MLKMNDIIIFHVSLIAKDFIYLYKLTVHLYFFFWIAYFPSGILIFLLLIYKKFNYKSIISIITWHIF